MGFVRCCLHGYNRDFYFSCYALIFVQCNLLRSLYNGKHGWCSGESARLSLGSIPRLGVMWVELFVGSLPSRVFVRVLWFSSLYNYQHFQTPIRPGIEDHLKIIYICNNVILVKHGCIRDRLVCWMSTTVYSNFLEIFWASKIFCT
jgi:hypothetical protein